jgi:hypothetical protein
MVRPFFPTSASSLRENVSQSTPILMIGNLCDWKYQDPLGMHEDHAERQKHHCPWASAEKGHKVHGAPDAVAQYIVAA